MYTWEIENLLKQKDYCLHYKEYINMIKTSPQIKRIKYNAYDKTLETWTKEENHTEKYFKYKIKKRTKY